MGIGEDFQLFCSRLAIATEKRSSISRRYELITRRLNIDFRSSDSSTQNSFYVGSYGRGTAISGFSDLDMLFVMPYSAYERYDKYSGNGQSALLQDVRTSLQKTYSTTSIGADGQVVVISFDDGITFEIVPAFLSTKDKYIYPDSNDGGRWRTTDPKPEISAISSMDKECNGNLKLLCRMMRSWKNNWSVPMGGLLIDTLAHRFIKDWEYKGKSYVYYDWLSRDFLLYLSKEPEREYWSAVGSGQRIDSKGNFQYKAKRCYNLALEAIEHDLKGQTWSSRQKWREIYGTEFPD